MSNKNLKDTIYGRYTLGSGAILENPDDVFLDIDNEHVIENYMKTILWDLYRAGISTEALRKFHVMDVGTGRQAIALNRLGAQHVTHYDLSPENVKNMRKFIIKNKKQEYIKSINSDIVEHCFSDKEYDYVYLHGIVQHFSNVGAGLSNVLNTIKKSGILHLYFYRSGSFKNFVYYMMRDISCNKNITDYYISSIMINGDKNNISYFSSSFIEQIFVENMYFYDAKSYMDFLERILNVVNRWGFPSG